MLLVILFGSNRWTRYVINVGCVLLIKTIGLRGIVKAIDATAKHILIQFFDAAHAIISEWWYPISVLESAPIGNPLVSQLALELLSQQAAEAQRNISPCDELTLAVLANQDSLVALYARTLLCQVISHPGMPICESPWTLSSVLQLAAIDFVDGNSYSGTTIMFKVLPWCTCK